MGKGHRLFTMLLLVAGLILSILSGTDLCNFGGCSEVHQYRLFGFSVPATGVVFFVRAGLLILMGNRFPAADMLYNLLLSGAAGAEINMILLQKNVVRAWCPLCLGIAAVPQDVVPATVVLGGFDVDTQWEVGHYEPPGVG